MDLLIHGGMIVTMNPEGKIWKKGALMIRGDRIQDLGDEDDLLKSYPDTPKMDGAGKAVLPGLVNLHTHTVLTVLRGVAEDAGIKSIYEQMMPMTDLMTPEDRYTMGLLGALEALKSGATTIVDNFSHMADIVPAVAESGLRAVVSEIVNDADLLEIRKGIYRFDAGIGEALLKKNVDLIEKWHGRENGRIRCHLGPHAPDTCSPRLLGEIKALAEKMDLGITIHIAQSPGEVEQVLKREGKRPVEYLDEAGFLGPRVIGGHCVHLSPSEIEILGRTHTHVAHNAAINARRGFIAPIRALKDAGANIGLGSDNMSEDMFEVMRIALMVGRIKTGNYAAFLPPDVMEMATRNGAAALGLEEEIGSLEIGKKADVILLDLKKPHLVPMINALGTLVHTGLASDVDTVIVDGRVLMEGRKVKHLREEEILIRAQETTERLWKDFSRKYR
jgi:5-methylthioadenosine/S-adenosylhomocysteine deaminase